ncbi:Catalase-like domain [Phaffia rhodozyma]|uniref:Catalase-like domain n=1 Tax=Phaffia rhodozyma TaxID=264483 RepID=A0A0F7SMR4_PHARH|nr:Catalase-like domain [Phaffia rhodozyma]
MAALVTSALSKATTAVKSTLVSQPKQPDDWIKWTEVEKPVENEEEKITKLIEITGRMQARNINLHGKAFRVTHVKSLAFVKGYLTISSDLPSHLQYGLFASPGKRFDVIGRYANEPVHILDDTIKSPRGLGIKVFGVEGNPIEGTQGTGSMDLHFNSAPMLELTDLDTCLEIFDLRERYWDDNADLQKELAKRADTTKQSAPASLPNLPVIGLQMYTQAAFRFGPYVAHFSLKPTNTFQTSLSNSLQLSSTASADEHSIELRTYFANHPAQYDLLAQFSSSLESQPVEDASQVWDEAYAPWIKLGELEFGVQDSLSNERRQWWENEIALSPFNALEDHRPLGSVNRLRKRVYEASRTRRAAVNGTEVKFPKSATEMPN